MAIRGLVLFGGMQAFSALTVKVFKVRQLDPFSHAQNIRSRTQAIGQHPNVPSI